MTFSGGVGNFLGSHVEIFLVGLGIFRVGLEIIREAGLTFFREGLTFTVLCIYLTT